MQTHELLDRFELLYLQKVPLADPQDVHTLTKIYLASLFRIISDDNKDDLRKLIMEDNTWKLWSLLDKFVETQFTKAFTLVNETCNRYRLFCKRPSTK